MWENLIEIIKTVGNLKRMPRMGWLAVGVPINMVENVSEHIMRVSFISMILCDFINIDKKVIDCTKVIKMALVHDVPEALFMDVGGEARNLLSRDLRIELEEKALNMIFKDFTPDLAKKYVELWNEYEKGDSLESKLVKIADKLDMFVQALEYIEMGLNKKMFNEFLAELDKFCEDVKKDDRLREFHKLFERVKLMFNNV